MISRKGSRPLQVHERRFRWRVRKKPSAHQRRGGELIVAVALEDGGGSTLLVRVGAHPRNEAGEIGVIARPGDVRRWVEAALSGGWTPEQPGPPVERRGRVSLQLNTLSEPAVPERLGDLRRFETRTLHFRPCPHGTEALIDGVPFLDLVREAERPHVDAENRLRAAEGPASALEPGQYMRLLVLKHTKGVTPTDEDHGFALEPWDPLRRMKALLICSCGDSGCWPLLAHVEAREGRVVWHSFQQLHRTWSYALGPLVFEEAAYLEAFRQRRRT